MIDPDDTTPVILTWRDYASLILEGFLLIALPCAGLVVAWLIRNW